MTSKLIPLIFAFCLFSLASAENRICEKLFDKLTDNLLSKEEILDDYDEFIRGVYFKACPRNKLKFDVLLGALIEGPISRITCLEPITLEEATK